MAEGTMQGAVLSPPGEDVRDRTRRLFAQLATDSSVRGELVTLHLPLAAFLARRYLGRGVALEDLVQVASLALVKAVDRFDSERGMQFSTFATPTILGELRRYFRDKTWAIRIPRRLQDVGSSLAANIPLLTQELGRDPTDSEIGEALGYSEDEVREATSSARVHSLASLDAPIFDEESSRTDQVGAEDGALEKFELRASLAPLILRLPERQRELLYLRFVAEETQSKVAERLGISQMKVSRQLAKTLTLLREGLGSFDG